MPRFTLAVASLAAVLIALPALGNTYFVAPDGDDQFGHGTKDSPWASVQRGVDSLEPGDTLYIRQGRYREAITIANSGEPDARITVAAYDDEEVILDGTMPVTGWEPVTEDDEHLTVHGQINRHWQNIYRARIHEDDLADSPARWMLFEDAVHSRVARWPDQSVGFGMDTGELTDVPEEAYGSGDALRDDTHLNPNNPQGFWHDYIGELPDEQRATYFNHARLHVWLRYGGNFQVSREITGYADNTIELESEFPRNRQLRSGDRYSIFRHPHALDSPGEFYFSPEPDDDGYHSFYLWPKDPSNLEARITFPARDRGIYALHKQHVTIDGLTVFGYTEHGIFFRQVAGSTSRNDGTIIRNCTVMDTGGGAGIWIQAASDSIVEDCYVTRVRGRGIFVTQGASENVIFRRNEVKDSSSTCISFYGVRRGQIIDNRIHGARGVHANGSSIYLGSRDILVARNIYYNGANATFQNIGNLVVFANVVDGLGTSRNRVAVWANTSNSDYPTQGFQIYAHNTIIRGDGPNHLLLLREASDNYMFNNIIGGSNSMILATRSHNAWVPLANRWENAQGRLNRRGEWDELEEGEWRIPRPELSERLPALFVDLDELDYRLNPDADNPAVGAGKDIQAFLEEKGVKEMFPEFDFTVDLAGNPWGSPPSLGAYELQSREAGAGR